MKLDYGKIGERIKKARESAGLSQQELGTQIGASTAAISLYESGERKPGLEFLINTAKALGVTLKELIEGYDKPPIIVSYRMGKDDDHDKLKEALEEAIKSLDENDKE